MNKNSLIRVAVLGLGYWGPNLVRNLTKIDGVKVIYGSDLSEENLKKISSMYPTIITTTDYKKILKDKKIDAVCIATPVNTHFSLAKEVLLAKKHVLIEKPMTKTTQQAKELVELAKKQNKVLMVGHTFVYSEAVQKIKQILLKGTLGKIYYYDSTRINLGMLQQDSNVVWDLMPHDLSIISYLFPEKPLSIQAFGASFINKKFQETSHIFITFQHGITAHVHVSWLSPLKIRNIFIGGSKKMIVYNDIEPTEKLRIYDKRIEIKKSEITPFSPAYRSGDVLIPHLPQAEALYNQLLHFFECIRNSKKPITNGEEGLKIVSLLENIDKALVSKSEIKL